jgi:Tol biopolymer transport system component
MKSPGGSKPEELFYSGAGDNFPTAWSPDGKYVLSVQLITGGGWDLTAIPVDGGEPIKLMSVNVGFGCTFSPDGQWLVMDTSETGTRDTFVLPFRGSSRKWQISTAGGFSPRWVGSHIYYFNERAMMRTEVTTRDSTISIGSEETLFEIGDLVDFDVTEDETKLLLLQTLDEANRAPLSVVLNWTQKLPSNTR